MPARRKNYTKPEENVSEAQKDRVPEGFRGPVCGLCLLGEDHGKQGLEAVKIGV